jgi:hypothetical protein
VHAFDLNVLGIFTQCSWGNATPSLYFNPYAVISHTLLPFVISASVYAIIIKSGSLLTYLGAITDHL